MKTIQQILKQNNPQQISQDLIKYYESLVNLPKFHNFKALSMTFRLYNKLTVNQIAKIYDYIKQNIPKPAKMFKEDYESLKRKSLKLKSKLLINQIKQLESKLNKGLLVLVDKKRKINEEIKNNYEECIKNNKNFNYSLTQNHRTKSKFDAYYDINYYNKDFVTSYTWNYKLVGFHDLRRLKQIAKKHPNKLELEIIESFNQGFKLDRPNQPKYKARYFYCTSHAFYLSNEDFTDQLNKIKRQYVKNPRKNHLIAYKIKNHKSLEELVNHEITQNHQIYDYTNIDRHIIHFKFPNLFNLDTFKPTFLNKSISQLIFESKNNESWMRRKLRDLTKFYKEFTFIIQTDKWENFIKTKINNLKNNIPLQKKFRSILRKSNYINLVRQFYRKTNKTIELGNIFYGNTFTYGYKYDNANIVINNLTSKTIENNIRKMTFEGNRIQYEIKKQEKFNIFFHNFLKMQDIDFNNLTYNKEFIKEFKNFLNDRALTLYKYPQIRKYFNHVYQKCFSNEDIYTIKISNF